MFPAKGLSISVRCKRYATTQLRYILRISLFHIVRIVSSFASYNAEKSLLRSRSMRAGGMAAWRKISSRIKGTNFIHICIRFYQFRIARVSKIWVALYRRAVGRSILYIAVAWEIERHRASCWTCSLDAVSEIFGHVILDIFDKRNVFTYILVCIWLQLRNWISRSTAEWAAATYAPLRWNRSSPMTRTTKRKYEQ